MTQELDEEHDEELNAAAAAAFAHRLFQESSPVTAVAAANTELAVEEKDPTKPPWGIVRNLSKAFGGSKK